MIFTYPNDFWHKRKIYNFDPYNFGYCYKYTCATYDWFCVQGHIYHHCSALLLPINISILEILKYM